MPIIELEAVLNILQSNIDKYDDMAKRYPASSTYGACANALHLVKTSILKAAGQQPVSAPAPSAGKPVKLSKAQYEAFCAVRDHHVTRHWMSGYYTARNLTNSKMWTIRGVTMKVLLNANLVTETRKDGDWYVVKAVGGIAKLAVATAAEKR